MKKLVKSAGIMILGVYAADRDGAFLRGEERSVITQLKLGIKHLNRFLKKS